MDRDNQKTLVKIDQLESFQNSEDDKSEARKKRSIELFQKWAYPDNTINDDHAILITPELKIGNKIPAIKDGNISGINIGPLFNIHDILTHRYFNISDKGPCNNCFDTQCTRSFLPTLEYNYFGRIWKYSNNETMQMMILPPPYEPMNPESVTMGSSSSVQITLPSTQIRRVRTKKNKTFLKHKKKYTKNKSEKPCRLCFAIADKRCNKIRNFFIQKNWVQKKIDLECTDIESKELNTKGLDLLLIQNPYRINKLWSSINDNTVVSCFPRALNGKEEKSSKSSDWIFHETVSPRTFIVNTNDDTFHDGLFSFIIEYHITTCIHVMYYALINKENLLSQLNTNGTIPLWVLTYAIENCKGISLSQQEYFSAMIPGQTEPRLKLEVSKEKREQHQMEMNKQNEFFDYVVALSTGSDQFKKSSNFNNRLFQSIKNKLEELGANMENFKTTNKTILNDNISVYASQDRFDHTRATTAQLPQLDTWITKTDSSKCYGLRCFKRLYPMLNHLIKNEYRCDYYVIQEFIGNQFQIQGKKFKIYNFVLIVSVRPLKTVPLKLYQIVINPCNENSSIYTDEEHFIKWPPRKFKSYLSSVDKKGYWENCIRPSIQESTNETIAHNHNRLLSRNRSFEIVRTTFILDDALKPWLINIESNANYGQFYQGDQVSQKIFRYISEKLESSQTTSEFPGSKAVNAVSNE